MAMSLLLLLTFIILQIPEDITAQQAICRCAELFPSENELATSNSNGQYSVSNVRGGETIIFTAMGFHCNGILLNIQYTAIETSCSSPNTSGSGNFEHHNPEFQLWKRNETKYELEMTQELTTSSSSIIDLTLNWNITDDHVIGLWIPSSFTQCYNDANEIQIGYIDRTIKSYILNGYQKEINETEHTLVDSNMPQITVLTSTQFDLICIIGLPTGGLITIVCLCIVCCNVIYSTKRELHKNRAEGFAITHTSPQYEVEQETSFIEEVYEAVDEEAPELPPRNHTFRHSGIQRANRPPPLNLQQQNGPIITAPVIHVPISPTVGVSNSPPALPPPPITAPSIPPPPLPTTTSDDYPEDEYVDPIRASEVIRPPSLYLQSGPAPAYVNTHHSGTHPLQNISPPIAPPTITPPTTNPEDEYTCVDSDSIDDGGYVNVQPPY